MKIAHFTPVLLVVAVLVGACSSTPKTTGLLDETRSAYQLAQSKPQVASYARLEMKQAGDSLEQANVAARRDDSTVEIDKLAYLAKQKIALAEEVAKRRSAEADVAGAGGERDRTRLDLRTKEADQASAHAETSKQEAQLAKERAAQTDRRATTVRNALHDMGVAPRRIAMRGYGEAYPVAANDTKQNRQLNRRVEIVVSTGEGQIPQR